MFHSFGRRDEATWVRCTANKERVTVARVCSVFSSFVFYFLSDVSLEEASDMLLLQEYRLGRGYKVSIFLAS